MELKKTYKGLLIWLMFFLVACFGVAFLPLGDGILMGRIVCNICTIGMAILTYMIYYTGYIYWYNGVSYEAAVKAGEERRKAYAWKHFKRFGIFAVNFLCFSIVAHLLPINFAIDIVLLLVGLVAVAISTINIEL
jgi:uncharacterized membrane protein